MGIAILACKTQMYYRFAVVFTECGFNFLFLFYSLAFAVYLNQLSPEWRSLSPEPVPTLGLVRVLGWVIVGHSAGGGSLVEWSSIVTRYKPVDGGATRSCMCKW